MAFCLTVGTHDFRSPLQGYEGVRVQCYNCGNIAAHVETEFPFFTICFVPLIPLATHKQKLVSCPVCQYKQDLSVRPDVQSRINGGGGGPPPGAAPQNGPPQGYQQQQYGPSQGYPPQQPGMPLQQQQGGYYAPQK